ncbi:MAG: PAS domain S-box protein, partial [Leptolyngbyaceae bacterium]|nr:PAS domain S-box protein [Leptolyngbyaceae bacterium]
DLDQILTTAVEALQELLQVDRALIYRFNADWSGQVVVESVAAQRWSILHQTFFDPCFQHQSAELYQQNPIRAIADVHQADLNPCHVEFLDKLEVKSNLVVAIVQDGQLWGLLICHSCQQIRPWHEREIKLVQEVGVQLAIALRQATTHSQLQTELIVRQETELQLRDSEQRFRRAIENAPFPIMIHAEDGEVLQISSSWTELTGYAQADMPTVMAWVTRAYGEQAAQVITQTMAKQCYLPSRREEGEFTITTADGSQRIWSFSSAPLGQLPDGRRLAIAMAADVTERHQDQVALATSESRYRALVDVISDLLIRLDNKGNYLDIVVSPEAQLCNPLLARIGCNLFDVMPVDHAEERMGYVNRALQTGEVQLYDYEINIEGETHWEEARVVAINDSEVLVIVRDISDRKRAEQTLQTLTVELEERVKKRTTVLAKTVAQLQAEIQQRQALEADLRQSQAQLQDLFDNANDMIQSVALADGSFELVNKAWLETLGYTTADLQSLTIFDVVHPSCQAHCTALIQQMFMGQPQRIDSVELRFVAKDGRVIEVEGSINCRIVDGQAVSTRGIFRDVTARKQTEQSLVEHQQKLSSVLNSVQDVVWSVHYPSFELRYVNDAVQSLYQQAQDDCQSSQPFWWDFIHPADRPQVEQALQALAQGEAQGWDLEYRIRQLRTGDIRWVHDRARLVHDPNQQATYLDGITTDITDRRAQAAELELLRLGIERSQDAIFFIKADGSFAFANQSAQQILGYPLAELMQRRIFDVDAGILPPTRAKWRELQILPSAEPPTLSEVFASGALDWITFWQFLKHNKTYCREAEWQHQSGHSIGVEITSNYLQLNNQAYNCAIVRNISQRQQAQAERLELIQQLAMFKHALDESAIVAVTNAQGVILDVNERFCAISGYSREEVLGQTHRLIHSGHHPPAFFQELWRTIARGQNWRGEICNRAKDGSFYWVDTTIIPAMDEQQRPYQYLAIRIDITAR